MKHRDDKRDVERADLEGELRTMGPQAAAEHARILRLMFHHGYKLHELKPELKRADNLWRGGK